MEKLNCTKDDLGTVACTMKAFKKQYCYPGFSGADLVEEMMCYGISGIALDTCGSTKLRCARLHFADSEGTDSCFG